MYIRNFNELPPHKIYWCNGLISNWLLEKGFPLLCKDGRKFGFAKTELLEEILLNIPFYLKVSMIF
jgi:hypothetical protein